MSFVTCAPKKTMERERLLSAALALFICACGSQGTGSGGMASTDASTGSGGSGGVQGTGGSPVTAAGGAPVTSASSSMGEGGAGGLGGGNAGGASSSTGVSSSMSAGSSSSSSGGGGSVAGVCASACPPGTKFCFNGCVATDDPNFGCGAGTCAPCDTPHGAASCVSGACAIAACEPGFMDCDGVASNGCEADLGLPATCRACDVACAPGQICAPSGCAANCSPPFTACGSRCVDLLTDPHACGGCFNGGTGDSNAFPSCSNAMLGKTCRPGKTLCASTCVDTRDDSQNCGGCGTPCTNNCVEGHCDAGPCHPGLDLCGGACTDLRTDAANCGQCGIACGASESCLGGSCAPSGTVWIVTGLSSPQDLTIDDGVIYWTDSTDNAIYSSPTSGGIPTLVAGGQVGPVSVATDLDYVYWSNNLGGAVMRTRKDGMGAPVVVAATTQPSTLVVDDTNVYWISPTGPNNEVLPLLKAPKTGISPPQQPIVLTQNARSLVTASGNLYVIDQNGVDMVDKNTGGLTFKDSAFSFDILAGGSDFCAIHQSTTDQFNCGWGDVGVTPPAGPGYDNAVVDACGLFMGSHGSGPSSGSITLLPPHSLQLITIYSGISVSALRVDTSSVYWTDLHAIGRAPKP